MCIAPLTVKVDNSSGVHFIQVPCGRCFECLKTKQNDYMVRIYEEMMQSKKNCFLTLTYSNTNVPYIERDGKRFFVVWKKDVKDWIKRFRTNFERKTGQKGIRYFLCSEYGSRTNRPHYHVIFFGLSKVDLSLAINDWTSRYGFVMAKDVSRDQKSLQCSARYVSKYACKGVFENPFRFASLPTFGIPPFFEGIRRELRSQNAIVPYFFLMSTVEGVYEENRLYKDWYWKELRHGLSGRGVESQVC